MFKRLSELLRKIKHYWSLESCYNQKEDEGYAAMGCCGGITGGDRNTNQLNYTCVDCPHYNRV